MTTTTAPRPEEMVRDRRTESDAGPAATPSVRDRAVAAALVCVARFGVGKTTADDVAREMGISRATLYRHVGSMPSLLATAVESEIDRVATEVEFALVGADTLETALIGFLETANHALRSQPALQYVVEHEPELVLPFLAFEQGAAFLVEVSRRFTSGFAPFVATDRDAARAAEWATRIALFAGIDTDPEFDLSDRRALHNLVTMFLVPAFTVPQGVTP